MIDAVLAVLAADDRLGRVLPGVSHQNDRDENRGVAENLAVWTGLERALPHHFDLGPRALWPLLEFALEREDYPVESQPIDGVLLQALERLVSSSVTQSEYEYATTYVRTSLR
jgi:hypothetical protein